MVSISPYQRPLSLATAVVTILGTGVLAATTPARAVTPKAPPTAGKLAEPPSDPIAAAVEKARSAGRPEPVAPLTDEYATTSANPDGTLTTVHSSSPQRVRQGDAWVPIDTKLVRRSDGSYAPRAATTGLSISGGDSTQLLSLKEGSRELTFTWPRALPRPAIAGDTATYREVYAGVDLQITADAAGYSSVFVVKSREAAANAELHTIDFGITGRNVRIGETPNGGAEAVDAASGEQVFHTDTAFMWDSTPTAAGTGSQAGARTADVPTARQPGRNMAEVPIDVGDGKQRLTLDKGLLTASTTTFPVYVDPYWSGSPGRSQLNWARISDNGWDVYNSTSKTGATSARIGYDNWPYGDAETARTYYQMNTSGIRGAKIFEANLYVVERWAASCHSTAAEVYATARPGGWSSSGLRWGKQPAKRSGVLSTAYGRELDCGTSKARVSPASLNFNVLSYVQAAAASRMSNATFVVQARSETDKYSWKQLGYGGGATLSVRYSYKPRFVNGTGNPRLSPSVADRGTLLTTTRDPTLSAQGFTPNVNGYQENVQIAYQIFNAAGRKVLYGYGPSSGYNLNGSAWRVNSGLPDGAYTWKAAIKNASGVWGDVWSATQSFTVDTLAPNAPHIKSTQFPSGQLGGGYTDRGVFEVTNDRRNNVTGYLFTLDGDLNNVTYAVNRGTPWNPAVAIRPGVVYFAKADNGNGTGTQVINGSAAVAFAPGTVGAHKIAAKAVDQAGSTSPQTVYAFHAGSSTPIFATGDKLISGWTATNADGTTTTVPAATTTSRTGRLTTQQNGSGYYFASGVQAWLANASTTSKVAVGDSATFHVNVPSAGPWEIGANLTTGVDYGTYTLTLDKGSPTEKVLITGFDAYSSRTSTRYVNFGIVKDGGTPRPLAQGLHSITLDLTGKNASSTGYQAGVDTFRLAPTLTCAVNNTTACFNNTATSTYTAGSRPTVTPADATGSGTSFEAADLRAAGWAPGSTVTVNGAAIKLPAALGTGAPDNMLSSGQIVTVPSSGVVNKGNAVVFTGFAAHPVPGGATGTITYGDGCAESSQAYELDPFADWAATQPGDAVLTLPRRNKSNATQEAVPVSIFSISVPLRCPGVPVTSISLPLVTNIVAAGAPSLHFFGLGIRPTSATGSDDTSTRWVGSWAAAQDTAAVKAQTAQNTSVDATLTNRTVRIPAPLSIGTTAGHQVRLRLANSLGRTPVTFDAVSLALQDSGAAAAAPPVPVTFNGARSVTLPAGGDLLSDPVTLTAPDRATALVSIKVRGALTKLAGHQDGRGRVYVSAADNVDHTGEQGAGNYAQSTILGAPFLAGIDVTTSTTNPAGSVVLFGDHTVNADTASSDGRSQLDARLAEALAATTETGNTVPFGVLNLGSSSWNNKAKLPANSTREPATATATVDRAILNHSNVRAVLISTGSSDLLACAATTAQACADPVKAKLTALAVQLRQFRTDDFDNPDRVPFTTDGRLKVYVATLPPFPAATAVHEAARKQVNDYILGEDGGNDLQGNTDGAVNFAAAVSVDGDHVSPVTLDDYLQAGGTPRHPNDLYYQTLAQQYLLDVDPADWVTEDQSGTDPHAPPVAVWKFDEGSGTTATDTGRGVGSSSAKHNAALYKVAWGDGRIARRAAGIFDGAGSFAETGLKPDTTDSFTVSAWVRLTDKSADRTVFSREAEGLASLYLRYQKTTDRWVAQMPSAAEGDSVVWRDAIASAPARTGLWTHLAATYDADLKTLTLAVDGVADTGVEEVTAFNEPAGPAWIGRSDSTWFAGAIADVKVWTRAINEAEMTSEAAATPVAAWDFDDDGDPRTVVDGSAEQNDGALVGSSTYTSPGHLGWDNGAVRLNGADAAVTSRPLVRTDQSFTAAAWVRLSRTDGTYTVLSQDGSSTGRFMIQWVQQCTCWRFGSADADQPNTTPAQASSPPATPLNTWTHVAAVYDAVAGTITLYVNGAAAGTATTGATPWNAGGNFAAGRTLRNGADAEWLPGDLDGVRVYQGALTEDAIKALTTT